MTRKRGGRRIARRFRFRPAWLIALGLGLVAFVGFQGAAPTTNAARPTDVQIEHGDRLGVIAKKLQTAGSIKSSTLFTLVATVTGASGHLKAGEYAFKPGANLLQVLQILRSGAVVSHRVTIPEGVTSKMVAQILEKAEFLSGDAPVAAEGAVLPETYQASLGEPRSQVLRHMTQARDRLLSELWQNRQPGLPFRTPAEAVTLASIVERETAKAPERPIVAGVYINRLRKGMRLESDPAVIYGLSGGAPLGHGLRASELARVTPYNTYKVSGLPPTPIGNPGRASLAAVLQPAKTDNLFFVADGTGGHVFAASFAAHQANVAKWRQIERTKAQ